MAKKYKFRKQFSDDLNKRIEESNDFANKIADDRLKSLNQMAMLQHGTPEKLLTPEETIKFATDMFDDAISKLSTTKLGGVSGSILYGALLLSTLPTTFGQVGQILWEKRVIQPLRKQIRPNLLNANEYIHAFFRKEMKREDAEDKIKTLGFSDEQVKHLFKLAEIIPSAQDVISFSVREVYNPEIVSKFGQSEGFESVFQNAKLDLEAIGMDKDTFRKFWEAHWVLPSVNQGFEMLHRGAIDDNTLGQLFTAQDIMPFWRDKLKAISFTPLTRVDVRRMHKLGVLSREGVKKAYTDIGYNPDNAELMTAFTEEYNTNMLENEETARQRRETKHRDLSKSDILKNFKLEMISKDVAADLLDSIGFDPDEAEYLLSREVFLKAEDEKDAVLDEFHRAYTRGVWDLTTLKSKFGELNLPDSVETQLIESWNLELEARSEVPSRADLLSFFKKGIITEAELRAELSLQGWSDKFIEWYIKRDKPGGE